MARLYLVFGALALSVLGAQALAQAQPWPSKPVKIIVPFAPGAGTDAMGRLLAQKLGVDRRELPAQQVREYARKIEIARVKGKPAPDEK